MDPLSLHAVLFVAAVAVLLRLPLAVRARRTLLLVANAAFLYLFHPLAPLVCAAASTLAYGAAALAARGPHRVASAAIAAPLVALLFLPKLWWLAGDGDGIGNAVGSRAALFIGASYFTLRALSFLIDVRRSGRLHLGYVDFLVYNSFFPTIIAGPIERADHFAKTYERLGRADRADLRAGISRIFLGLLKKAVLGSILLSWAAPLQSFADGQTSLTTGDAWISLYAWVLYTYVDFAGYSDLALGVARLLGIRLAENFDNPLLRNSIAEFWRGWHISLSFWIRDYLFLPLCGKSRSSLRPHLAALASMTLCGLWHAPNAGWALWGLAHGAGLSLHQAWTLWLRNRFRLKLRLQRSPVFRVVATVVTFHFVAGTWILTLGGNDLRVVLRYLAALSGAE